MIIELTANKGEEWVGDIEIIVRNGEIDDIRCEFTCDGKQVDELDVPEDIIDSIIGQALDNVTGLKSQRQIDLEENGRWG